MDEGPVMSDDEIDVGSDIGVTERSQDTRNISEKDNRRTRSYAGAARTGLRESQDRPIHVATTPRDIDNDLPKRPCTVVINPRGNTTAADIFKSLEECNIGPPAVGCIQRRTSGEIEITFRKKTQKEAFLSQSAMRINNEPTVIQDYDYPLTFLNIYDAPHELPDTAIIDRLTPYCEVLHHRRGKFRDPEGVFNGIRHYRVRIRHPIPSYLRFGKFQIVLKHDRQIETCRHCNQPGHYAYSCRNQTCFNCNGIGHQSRTCPFPVRCNICRSSSHRARTCPFSWDRQVEDNKRIDTEENTRPPQRTEQEHSTELNTEEQRDNNNNANDSDSASGDSSSSSSDDEGADSDSNTERETNYTSATEEITHKTSDNTPEQSTKQTPAEADQTYTIPENKTPEQPTKQTSAKDDPTLTLPVIAQKTNTTHTLPENATLSTKPASEETDSSPPPRETRPKSRKPAPIGEVQIPTRISTRPTVPSGKGKQKEEVQSPPEDPQSSMEATQELFSDPPDPTFQAEDTPMPDPSLKRTRDNSHSDTETQQAPVTPKPITKNSPRKQKKKKKKGN